MKEELFWILLSKKLTGEASEAELLHLTELIENNASLASISENLVELWDTTPEKGVSNQVAQDAFLTHIVRLKAIDPSFQATDESTKEESPFEIPHYRLQMLFSKPKKLAAYSFSLLAIVFIGFQVYFNNFTKVAPVDLNNLNELTINPGSKSKITLPLYLSATIEDC